jgi:hypothetical protein
MDVGVMFFVFLAVGALALFSFLAVIVWSKFRWKEREAFYRSEMVKKIAETGGAGSTAALEFLREQEKSAKLRDRVVLSVAGLITMSVGIALMIFLNRLVTHSPVYLSGLFPLIIGIILFAAPRFVGRKE